MKTNIDLKGTERASFKLAAYADGTADLGLGLVFILLGIYPFTRELLGPAWNFPLFLLVLGIIVYAQIRVKKHIAPSRIGIVKLGQRAQKRAKVALLVTAVLLALTVLTWMGAADGIFFQLSNWMGSYGMEIIVAIVILAIFWGMAYSLELQRYYFYGVLLATCFPLQGLLPVYDGLPYLIAGAVITGIGATLMNRFLKGFPETSPEVDNG